ncbi:MAG: SDR family oxidoreductase [Nocardioidaceae bacterium]
MDAACRAFGHLDVVVLFTSGQYHSAMPGELPYIASKGSLHQLTPSLAVHLMARGITVNCVDPGPTHRLRRRCRPGRRRRAQPQAAAGALPPTPPGWSATRPAG